MEPDELQMKRDWLAAWASDRKLILEDRGEVGFGRPCVGITDGRAYIDLGPEETIDMPHGAPISFATRLDEAKAPDHVNYYHKTECLAVLVEGDDYDAGLSQLFDWVQSIDEAGLIVKQEARRPTNAIEAVMHGTTRTFLQKEAT